jgi:glutathionylspermidine synthase
MTALQTIKSRFNYDQVNFVASSLGYAEDIENCNTILNTAYKAGFHTQYVDLQEMTFSEEEGIFYELAHDEFQPVDVWFKMIPWDWMFTHEPDLAKLLSRILEKKFALILNPPYTTVWQNKKFMAYITQNFPNTTIAETYTEVNGLMEYAKKPIYGRIGVNIELHAVKTYRTQGDYGSQPAVYHQYYPLAVDRENYSYQFGMFYADKPLALNVRIQDSLIINDDCDFMPHFII